MQGGRWALTGFLYQLLGGLGHIGHAAISEARVQGNVLHSLQLTLEPESGGDLQLHDDFGRIVEQYKTRDGPRPWSTADIVENVLPNLCKSVILEPAVPTSRYRFVSNGRVAAKPLRELIKEVKRIERSSDPLTALDAVVARHVYKRCHLTDCDFFLKILQTIGDDADPKKLWHLLHNLEINDRVHEDQFLDSINHALKLLVDKREDLESKRDELLGQILRRAKAGESVSAADILRKAGLHPERLVKRNRLVGRLCVQTYRALEKEAYSRAEDVREAAPPYPKSWFTVLTGESGQGKTWQLLRLAHEFVAQEKPSIVLFDIASLEELEKELIKILWHESGFDSSLPLPNVLERLADVLPEPPVPLLTIFIDDVQDRNFATRLLGADLEQLRVQVVLSAQPRIARALQESTRAKAEVIPIDRFSVREVRDYLSGRQVNWTELPNDVLNLLRQPIMAKLYADTATQGWTPETEYALLKRYWHHVTAERREQDDHPQDIEPVKELALRLFEGVHYPWTQRAAGKSSLHDEIQRRLISAGLLRREETAIALSHDRLLNWTVAEALAERVLDGELSIESLYERLYRILRVDAEWREDRIFLRLRYVPMDVLWLLVDKISPRDLANLIARLVRRDHLCWDSKTLLEELLPTLGVRLLPAITQFALHHQSEDDYWSLGKELASSIMRAGSSSRVELTRVATEMIGSQDLAVQRVGLIIAAKTALPEQVERLWELHRAYALRRDAKEKYDGVLENYRREHSTAALAAAIEGHPGWVSRKLSTVVSEDEIVDLVELTMKLNRTVGPTVWDENKEKFFERLPCGKRCLPRAVHHFRDKFYLDWLIQTETNSAEHLAVEIRFDALVRLAPEKALKFLRCIDPQRELLFTKNWWLRILFYKLGQRASVELRRYFARGDWTSVQDLAILYQGYEDLLDTTSLTMILETFEVRLEAHDHLDDWPLGAEGHFLRLLSNLGTPRLLRHLEAKRGSRFEQLLTRRAIRQGGQKGIWTAPDVCEYRSVLLKIGGDGLATVLAHDLKSDNVWTRVNALQRAIWNPTEAVRGAVREVAARDQHEEAEQLFLMKVLASFEEDETFAAMLRRGVPLYQEAFDIRRTKSPVPTAIRDRACAEALSEDEPLQLAGIAILSLCKGDEVAQCLQTVLASNNPTSAVARSAVLALDDIDYVSEETICFVTPMMQHREQQRVVFTYLLRRGAQAGEAAVAKYFAAHDRNEVTDSEEQAARILIARQERTGEAAKFLWDVVKQRKSAFGHTQNLLALTQLGDSLAEDLLLESSLAERSFGGSSITAIRGLLDRDSGYAFEAAMRLLENDLEAGGEDVLLKVDSARAIPFLLDLLARDIDTLHRWRICRHLRWLAPQDQLEVKLSKLAKDHDPAKRAAACEVIGWLPPGSIETVLDECINDIENVVEEAALAALKKHKEQRDVRALLSEIKTATGPARWCRFYALLDLFDPRALARNRDPLCIWPILDEFPFEFTKEAERVLKRRLDREKQEAKEIDRRRRSYVG